MTERMNRRFEVILVPEFTQSTLVSALDVMQAANRVLGRKCYEWSLSGRAVGPVVASNGLSVFATKRFDDIKPTRTTIVCSGLNPSRYTSKALLNKLRFLRYHGSLLGGLCTGSFALAMAGLLDEKSCTVHWQFVPSFREMFPSVNVTQKLFENDGEFFSSAGLGTIDLMLDIVARDH